MEHGPVVENDVDKCYICFDIVEKGTCVKCSTCKNTWIHYACVADVMAHKYMTSASVLHYDMESPHIVPEFECGVHRGPMFNTLKIELRPGYGVADSATFSLFDSVALVTMALKLELCVLLGGLIFAGVICVTDVFLLSIALLMVDYFTIWFKTSMKPIQESDRQTRFRYLNGHASDAIFRRFVMTIWFDTSAYRCSAFLANVSNKGLSWLLSLPMVELTGRVASFVCALKGIHVMIVAMRLLGAAIASHKTAHTSIAFRIRVFLEMVSAVACCWWGIECFRNVFNQAVDDTFLARQLLWIFGLEKFRAMCIDMSVLIVYYVESFWRVRKLSVTFEATETNARQVIQISLNEWWETYISKPPSSPGSNDNTSH